MTTLLHRVRCDRKAQPWWEAVPADERDTMQRAIPDDCYITILHSNATPPFTARLLQTTPDPHVNILRAVSKSWVIEAAVAGVLADVA